MWKLPIKRSTEDDNKEISSYLKSRHKQKTKNNYLNFLLYFLNILIFHVYMIWWEKEKLMFQISLATSFLFPKPRSQVFFSFSQIRQSTVSIYRKEQKTLGSRLLYFCINLFATWGLWPVCGLSFPPFEGRWTFDFRKFISYHDSISYVHRDLCSCAMLV